MFEKESNIKVLDVSIPTEARPRMRKRGRGIDSTPPKSTFLNAHLDEGSIELVVIGMLAALIVLLAIPLFSAPEMEQESGKQKTQAHQEEKA